MRIFYSHLSKLVLLCLALLAQMALAGELLDGGETGFKPFVELNVISDSNVYRVESDGALAAANVLGLTDADQQDDISLDAAVGFEMATETAAQRLELDARILRQTYTELSSLDNTGGEARMLWKWQPVANWNGRVRASYEKLRRSFDNRLQLLEDMREKKRIGVESRFLHSGNWRSIVSVDLIDTTFEEEENLDKQRVVVEVGAHKLGQRDNNHYGIEARAVQADFDRLPEADYKQQEVVAVLDWQVTEKTHVAARAGWTRRDLEDNVLRSDYSGVTGALNVRTQFNEDFAVEGQVYRKLSNLSDEIADYTRISGVRVAPQLALGARTTLSVYAAYEQHDFSGNFSNRDDKVYDAGVEASWKFSGQSSLVLAYRHLEKESNLVAAEYDTDVISLGVRFVL
jgi:hypothetical protein